MSYLEAHFVLKTFIKSYDTYRIRCRESGMKKLPIVKEGNQVVSEVSEHNEELLDSAIIVSLEELPRESRKKEAGKPLYLTRYE